jgi:hypothetical protein
MVTHRSSASIGNSARIDHAHVCKDDGVAAVSTMPVHVLLTQPEVQVRNTRLMHRRSAIVYFRRGRCASALFAYFYDRTTTTAATAVTAAVATAVVTAATTATTTVTTTSSTSTITTSTTTTTTTIPAQLCSFRDSELMLLPLQ